MHTFDIKKRDGLARTGVYSRDGRKYPVPGAYDPGDLVFAGDIPRHANIPLIAPEEFVLRYAPQPGSCVFIHPRSPATGNSGDCVLVGNWHTALDSSRFSTNWLVRMKERQPSDTLWYAPAAALPSNAAFLVYSGFDLFDFTGVDLRTAQQIFCTAEGEFPADEWFSSDVCTCPGCQSGDLAQHNRDMLIRELALSVKYIVRGQLRELVEMRCRMNAGLVAALRHFDEHFEFIEEFTPVVRTGMLLANSGESINRPEVRRFADRVIERFIPVRDDVCVLLPCSARKPYSFSRSHRFFQNAIQMRAHEVIVTSPLGVVPRELESIYPAAHYDVPVTGYWDREESAKVADVLTRYFLRHPYRRVIAHLDGGAREIVTGAAEEAGIELECTCIDRPVSKASLTCLAEALEGERKRPHDRIIGTLAWQFGSHSVDTRHLRLRGRAGRQAVMQGNMQVFSIDPDTGLFRPTFAGWDLIKEGYRVHIDDFVPHGDVLVPGVLDCDPAIREGDEVFVEGTLAYATGRAVMGAREMSSSRRGVAVKVRKVKMLV
jgi:archaeosine synthase